MSVSNVGGGNFPVIALSSAAGTTAAVGGGILPVTGPRTVTLALQVIAFLAAWAITYRLAERHTARR